MMKIFDFGQGKLQLILPKPYTKNIINELNFIGHSIRASTLPNPKPAFDEGAIIPSFTHKENGTSFLRDSPELKNKNTFWATKLCFRRYVKTLYELNIINSKNIHLIENNRYVGEWAREMLAPIFIDVFGIAADITLAGATLDLPNQHTTSINRKTGKRVGLHIDTFRMKPIKERIKEKYRCVINIGEQRRYFIFDPRHGGEIIGDDNTGMCPDETGSFSPTRTLRRSSYAEPLQLFSLLLEPGEGYIAPTEVIPHDASTFGQNGLGAMYTLRGYFSVKQLSEFNTKLAK